MRDISERLIQLSFFRYLFRFHKFTSTNDLKKYLSNKILDFKINLKQIS